MRNDLSAAGSKNRVSEMIQPWWLRLSERAFSFNFIAFSFVMFSCWFPTGFSATFSTFAFFSALPIFFYRIGSLELTLFEKMGMLLFGWLSFSIAWSEVPIWDSLVYLSEYRIYFMLPILITALSMNRKLQSWAFMAAIAGAFIALLTSYGLAFGWWKIDGAHLSLANRIYHGFIMSILLLVCILIARESSGWIRLATGIISLLVILNILTIETGRTGYLQVISICFLFAFLVFSGGRKFLAVCVFLCLLAITYLYVDSFHTRINQTFANVGGMLLYDNHHSSAGLRLEFYRVAIHVGIDYPLTGVGVGDVKSTLLERVAIGELRAVTDNVHSEFMNMLIAGGFPAVLMFAGFLGSIIRLGISVRNKSRFYGDALIGLGLILFVSALFNSTIKDYGEKHVLIIVLSIAGASMLTSRRLNDWKVFRFRI